MPRTTCLSFFAIILLMLPSSALAQRMADCAPDPRFLDRYYTQSLLEDDNAFAHLRAVKRLGENHAGPTETRTFLMRYAAEESQDPLIFAAYWALSRRFGPNALPDGAAERAAEAAGTDNIYTAITAAAFLASLGKARAREVDAFLPTLLNEARKVAGDSRQIFRRGMLGWVFHEIGGPLAGEEARAIQDSFAQDMFPKDAFLLNGIDGLSIIGPAAVDSVPILGEVVNHDGPLETFLYDDDAARALMVIGTPQAVTAAQPFFADLREDILKSLPGAGPGDPLLAEAQVRDALDLLPYSLCLKPEIQAVADAERFPTNTRRRANKFLMITEGLVKP